MNNIDILDEKENINLENKYKQTLKMAKEVMEDVCERNNGCEPSKSECLAYNMQYVKKYVETLIAENKELKEEKLKKSGIYEFNVNIEDDYIPKSKVKGLIDEYKKQIEKMEKDDIGIGFTLGKKWADLKSKVDICQSLLGKE